MSKENSVQPPAGGFGERRFGRFNWLGLWTLFRREVLRFANVYTQTLVAPVVTAGLFLAVFSLAFASRRGHVEGVPFATFLAPGVVMMTVIQNAFANTSSSILIAKIQGNIVDTLMPPLSAAELTFSLAMGGVARGVLVAVFAALALFPFVGAGVAYPLWALYFVVFGAMLAALIGLAAGIWAMKFDHIAAVTNFIITPLSFLSGTFYSISALPQPWRDISSFNPFFYLIDGFRYGILGASDASPWIGATIILIAVLGMWALCWRMFSTGYNLKN